jgi:hypothetical protein
LNDDDKQVQQFVGDVFTRLGDDDAVALREFIVAFAASPALATAEHSFAEFLQDHGTMDPEGSLEAISAMLRNQQLIESRRHWFSEQELIRAVIRIYTDPSSSHLRTMAMDLFDQLMERDEGTANAILGEWDRR